MIISKNYHLTFLAANRNWFFSSRDLNLTIIFLIFFSRTFGWFEDYDNNQ